MANTADTRTDDGHIAEYPVPHVEMPVAPFAEGMHGNGTLITNTVTAARRQATISVANGHDIRENAEVMEAREFFEQYLSENVQTVKTLKEMEDIVRAFKLCAPILLVWKCIDGRVHGSKGKGYPIGTIEFGRTEGAKIDIDVKNNRLWRLINAAIADAKEKTPGMPAMVIQLGHYASDPHRCCAAHHHDREKALETVALQTKMIREKYYSPKRTKPYTRDEVVFIHGMTNTDDMSEELVFEHGEKIASADTIDELQLMHPSDVFSAEFLEDVIHDPTTQRYTNGMTVRRMLEGDDAPIYQQLRPSLAMETFLMQRIREIVNRKGKDTESILKKEVFDALYRKLDTVRDLPKSLIGPLLYQFVWNIAYTLYQRTRLKGMNVEEQKHHLDHAEELGCYGENYETLRRNKACLAKPGRGDEIEALTTMKKVLKAYSPLKHLPMIHINVALTDRPSSWDSFKANVIAEIMRMKDNVEEVFNIEESQNYRILCTYSYKDERQFYPIKVDPGDPRECVTYGMTDGFTEKSYTSTNLENAELTYMKDMLQQHKEKNGSKPSPALKE